MNNLVSLVLILASFGLFFGFVDPTYMKVKEVLAEKADYDKALDNSKELQVEREKIQEKLNAIPEVEIEKLKKMIPDHIDNVRLILDIDEMAKTYHMRIRNFETEAVAKKETIGKDSALYGTLTLSFSTTATYNTFLAFMRDLEQSLRIIDVTGITFTATEGVDIYDYKVTIKTYWLK
jgi:hypothetical protein